MNGRLAVLLTAVGLVLAGCASIPGDTLPQKVYLGGGGNAPAAVAQPPHDASALTIVRGFVNSSGDATGGHAAARVYLTDAAQKTWGTTTTAQTVNIILTTFNTTGPVFDGANSATVTLQGHLVGTVGPYGGFTPADLSQATDYGVQIHLRRQSDGQWRIDQPPPALLLKTDDFDRYYRPVSVYFFDPTWDVLVPDQRYVIADPPDGVAARIVQLLLDGPSDSLKGAVQNAIPGDASLQTNVVVQPTGEIIVNFKRMQDQPSNVKQLMIAQIVRSLQNYGSGVAVQSEAQQLVPGHLDWRSSDLPAYEIYIGPKATPLVTSHGKVLTVTTGVPIKGPAGDGTYNVVTAAESGDGTELATVTAEPGGGETLRIGGLNAAAVPVKGLTSSQFTRPSWTPSDSAGDPSRSLWTVADGTVLRVVNTPQGSWAASPVDVSALSADGPITDLRLSRDGVRVAVVAGGALFVGAVVVDQGSVSIRQVRQLQPGILTDVTRVDWLAQDQLVVSTSGVNTPVLTVGVDGRKWEQYTSANLASSVTDIAAADGQPVLAVDAAGLWESSDTNEAWQQVQHPQSAGAVPFYPG
ncbi:MAG TPA: LpqB family beta-propeller domain-containing protein [Pseudonocardiaceae bacterium]|nr:LpqB family beta-propeller domain-containing protein [Pseudonocardiaceae bacterium]